MNDSQPQTAAGSSGPNAALLNNIQLFSNYATTIKATALAICEAGFLPMILAIVAWQLQPAFDTATLRGAIVRGLYFTIPLLFFSLVLAKALRPGGLAENHFGWSPVLTDGLLKTIGKLVWVCIPLGFLCIAIEAFQGGIHYDSLGRVLFIASMIVLTTGLWSTGNSMRRWLEDRDGKASWVCGCQRVLMTVVAILPLAFGLMAGAGYHFTAVQLSGRLAVTILVVVGTALSTAFVSRVLLITQFRIKLRQLNRNSEGEIDQRESIDIGAISTQVNSLLRVTALVVIVVASWHIWSNVLSVIGYLDDVELWQLAIDADGTEKFVTLRHLFLALGVLSITYVLSRNLPGLLEITLLDRLPLDRGGRYAISFVVRYVVGIIGALIAFQIVGFSWSKVQWLAAGLTVGLGFGLQEIFANLVSGIIILIERPVRVGDVVTVNGVTGTVTRMQLRATTIKDLDYRELIVPNKKFITEDVMNWTLSDRLSRLIFPVGVAYGSNTRLVETTLLEVARQCPLVLNDPQPQVVFGQFGDSALNFELRVVIPSRDQFEIVRHDLNMRIDQAFRDQKIEIAFPQQDIHIKGMEGAGFPPPSDDRPKKAAQDEQTKRRVSVVTFPRNPDTEDLTGNAFARRSPATRPSVIFPRRTG
jgi:potassium efflux system protein